MANHTFVPFEIVIADCEGELLGYTRPQNEAMAAAQADLLLAVNDDVEVATGWFEPLAKAVRAGAWCATPDMTHTDGPQVFHPYCSLWSREGWREVGGLDNRFVFWASDIDIARRLIDAGHPPAIVPLPESIRHQTGATATETRNAEWMHETTRADLDRFREKWGVDAEQEKYRLRDIAWPVLPC